jgi:cytidylate kinase
VAEPAQEALRTVRAIGAAQDTWTVLVDGRAGAGKSTLARLLAAATGAALVRLDDVYPGWDGLEAGAEAVRRSLLAPRAIGEGGTWQRWDWAAARPAEEHHVAATGGLICEGCGVLSRRSAPLAALRIWVELDAERRKARALRRDGELFAPHWDRWAAQEEAVIRTEDPASLADLVVDGGSVRPELRGQHPGDSQ